MACNLFFSRLPTYASFRKQTLCILKYTLVGPTKRFSRVVHQALYHICVCKCGWTPLLNCFCIIPYLHRVQFLYTLMNMYLTFGRYQMTICDRSLCTGQCLFPRYYGITVFFIRHNFWLIRWRAMKFFTLTSYSL